MAPNALRPTMRLLLLAGAILSATGCAPPPLVFLDGPNFRFADTALTRSTPAPLTVENRGGREITIAEVRTEGFAAAGPFRLVAGKDESGCAAGEKLAPEGGRCDFVVEFHPIDEVLAGGRLTVIYHEGDADDLRGAFINLGGRGVLDCTVAADLAAARASGEADAAQHNEAEAAKARAEAAALTVEDGRRDGYAEGHAAGYREGYDGPAGFAGGHRAGYTDGYARGASDPAACAAGARDGDVAGRADGFAEGVRLGYADGFAQGQAEGGPLGYEDGWSAGEAYCSGNVRPNNDPPAPAPDEPSPKRYVDACHKQGYSARIDPGTYARTFESAKWRNPAYKNGYEMAQKVGYAEGRRAGEADGSRDGWEQGSREGYRDGADDNYAVCFDQQYAVSFSAARSFGYDDPRNGFPGGYDRGYRTEYAAQYDVGYRESVAYFCQ